jgi:hypothetical protein
LQRRSKRGEATPFFYLTIPTDEIISSHLTLRVEYENCIDNSNYIHLKEDRLLSEDEAAENKRILANCFGDQFRAAELGLRHIDKGIYYDQIERWFQNFNRDQFLIIKYEEWIKQPKEYFDKTLQFMGQEMIGENGFKSEADLTFLTKNFLSTSNTKKSSLPDDVMHELACFYKPYNEKLNALLKYEVYDTNIQGCV